MPNASVPGPVSRAGPSHDVWSMEPGSLPSNPGSWLGTGSVQLGRGTRAWTECQRRLVVPCHSVLSLENGAPRARLREADDRVRFMTRSFLWSAWQQGWGFAMGGGGLTRSRVVSRGLGTPGAGVPARNLSLRG